MATPATGQLTLAGMPQRLLACTPSRLSAFDCPRRYRFAYLQRPTPARGGPWAHATLGAVVHLALAGWWLLPRRDRDAEHAGRLVETNWEPAGFRDPEHSARWRQIARSWVERYVGERLDPDAEPVGVERTVATSTRRLAFSGRVDRIDERAAELVVVDYKTGRRELDEDDARGSQALALYALAARRTLRRPCSRVELHHVPSGRVVSVQHSEESLDRHLARAEATAADIRVATDTLASGADVDEVFPPNPSPACTWCDFRRHCPQGLACSAEAEPWAGLATEPA